MEAWVQFLAHTYICADKHFALMNADVRNCSLDLAVIVSYSFLSENIRRSSDGKNRVRECI